MTMTVINRILWMIVFFAGVIYFALLEWRDESSQALGWFLLTGLWSAFCGIGFTILDWVLRFKKS